MLTIKVLGELSVELNGNKINLPPSKKTRALLVFLILTKRPHRRDRLCELFWELPDDPRGALRWSLSKIRNIVNTACFEQLIADRERVEIDTSAMHIDLRELEDTLENKSLSVESLQQCLTQLQEPLLEGIDLPNQQSFQNWLTAERNHIDELKTTVLSRLSAQSVQPTDSASQVSANSQQRISQQLLKRQKIKFCTTNDKVRLAYATVGEGPPLVKAANWLSHLELDWDAPIWSPLFRELAQDHHFIRYDERGNGLSDWDVRDISFNAFVEDLEVIADSLSLDKFPLLGISQGAAVSIEYAVRHPERVSHLILFGAYSQGWRIDASPQMIKEREAIMTLTETGWGQDNPAYRQIFSSTFMPSANTEQLNWFNEFQRQTTSPENAVRFQSAFGDIDVRHQLSEVRVPTLVIHSAGDRRIPLSSGREIAASIPNAEFVSLNSDNHLLIENEPAAQEFVDAVRQFISTT